MVATMRYRICGRGTRTCAAALTGPGRRTTRRWVTTRRNQRGGALRAKKKAQDGSPLGDGRHRALPNWRCELKKKNKTAHHWAMLTTGRCLHTHLHAEMIPARMRACVHTHKHTHTYTQAHTRTQNSAREVAWQDTWWGGGGLP